MPVTSVTARDFRSYEAASAALGGGITVLCGPNGAGKTNLLEAIYFGCTGRSCRTANDRELVRFGAPVARVTIGCSGPSGTHELSVGFAPGDSKRMAFDGSPVERLLDLAERPLVSVFLPDRLELVKGVPALRRAHLDQFVAALWPARITHRRAYAAALAQRNALLARVRSGEGSRAAFEAWDLQLARHALELMADRREAVARAAEEFTTLATQLGLDGEPGISYRPRSHADDAEAFVEELRERLASDLERGFTGHGPHRDDLAIVREGRQLRAYGSQGQQRIALLALLLAERKVLGMVRDEPPLMLLDDVMSELDATRREALVALLADSGGQTLITTTDLDHVPRAGTAAVRRLAVSGGAVLQDLGAAA